MNSTHEDDQRAGFESGLPGGFLIEATRAGDPQSVEALRRRLVELLLGLVAAAGDAPVTFRVGSTAPAGSPLLEVTVQGPPDAAAELRALLAPLYTTGPLAAAEREEHCWPLVAAPSRVGFSAAATPAGGLVRLTGGRPAGSADFDGWLRLAAACPGLELRLTLHPVEGAKGRFHLSAEVCFPGPALPLRARALLLTLLPDLTLGDRGEAGAHLVGEAEDVAAYVPLPAADSPLPEAPPLPLPLRPRPATPSLEPEDGFRIGHAVLPSGHPRPVHLTRAEAVRHLHVVGQTGTGKSSLLAGLMHSFASQGLGFVLIDPHGDLADRCLAELPEDAAARTWLIRAGDLAHPVPINPLSGTDADQLETVIQDLVLAFYQLFDPTHSGIVGPRFEAFLINGIRGLRELRGDRANLLDVQRAFRDKRIERAIAAAVTDPQLVDFWCNEMPQMSEHTRSETTGWVTSKFDRFANTQAMRKILGTGADAFNMAQAMDENRIVLLDLSKSRLGAVAADMLGFLHLSRIWTGFQNRTSTTPYGVFVDEAHSFNAGSLPTMLSEGRKRGASIAIAHQYIGQLQSQLADALAGNVATTAAFRCSVADALTLRERFGRTVSVPDLTTAADLTAVLNRSSDNAGTPPHTLVIDQHHHVTARYGAALTDFEDSIVEQTRHDLVDPYRDLSPYQPIGRPTRTGRHGAYDSDRSASPDIDEWLRQRRARATAPQPTT